MDRSNNRYPEPPVDYELGDGRQNNWSAQNKPLPPPMPPGPGYGPPGHPQIPRIQSAITSPPTSTREYQPGTQNYGYQPEQQSHSPPERGYQPRQQNNPPPEWGYAPPPSSAYPPPQERPYPPQPAPHHPPQRTPSQLRQPSSYPPPERQQQQQYDPPRQIQPLSSYPAPIILQPGAGAFNQAPVKSNPSLYGVPAASTFGLDYLASLDHIVIRQRTEMVEVFLGCETKNKYRVLDPYGRQIFYAKEDTDICTRQCCGAIRPFDMILTDESDQEVIHFNRPLRCGSCCYPCCLQEIEIQSPAGIVVGSVEQKWSIFIPKFYVKDAAGQVAFYIEGPCWTASCCGSDVEFKIYDPSKSIELGAILKKWSGCIKECYTDADNFEIHFPLNLNVRMKTVLLGACMLIDFMYFEK